MVMLYMCSLLIKLEHNMDLTFMLGCDNILQIYGYRTLVPEDYVEYFHRVCASSQLESCSKCPHFVPLQKC